MKLVALIAIFTKLFSTFSFSLNYLCIFNMLAEQEVVGRWAAQQEKESKLLARTDGGRLFSNLTRGNHYLVQAEGYLNNSGSGQTSEMALTWNRTLPGGSVSNGLFYISSESKKTIQGLSSIKCKSTVSKAISAF